MKSSPIPFSARARAWFFLLRPWSVMATLVPFSVAAGIAVGIARDEGCRWTTWSTGLVAGLLYQAAVNLLNTWGDERSGVDAVPGAIRTTPQVHDGYVSMRATLLAGLGCAALASLLGVALCCVTAPEGQMLNLPLLGAGFVGCLGALNYSTGIRFKYHGLGVPFVSFLMGPLEIFVALLLVLPPGSPKLPFTIPALVALVLFALPIAALVGVIMHGNDMRDIPTDRAAGIVTLASRLGPRGALLYYTFCHLLPYAFCALAGGLMLLISFSEKGPPVCSAIAFLPPFLALPLSSKTLAVAWHTYRGRPENPPWRGLERGSGGIHLVFGLLYALTLPLLRLLGA